MAQRRIWQATTGIIIGLILGIIAAVGAYFDWKPGQVTNWVWMIVPALPLSVWGCANLAWDKGYPGAAAYGLFVLGLLVSGFIGITRSPGVFGCAFVFTLLMPVVVLLVLPAKPRVPGRGYTGFRNRNR